MDALIDAVRGHGTDQPLELPLDRPERCLRFQHEGRVPWTLGRCSAHAEARPTRYVQLRR